jgi:hypothetical protein
VTIIFLHTIFSHNLKEMNLTSHGIAWQLYDGNEKTSIPFYEK